MKKTPLGWVRSLLFIAQMYVMMAVWGIVFLIPAIFSRDMALLACKSYARYVRLSARWIIGLHTEVRGALPEGEIIIAAKHQSFLDILIIASVTPRFKFIIKRELIYAPILGWFALRLGCVPVNRGKRAEAMKQMLADVAEGRTRPGQLVIYAQGTRVAPGVKLPYKAGAGVLAEASGQDCVPAATNVGLFWPKHGLYRHPGVAVVEFLPPIKPGLSVADFTKRLEHEVETASDALMAEAGFMLPETKD